MKAPPVVYHLCPTCFRATPAAAEEHYCPNDGTALLKSCPNCGAGITSPYSHYCIRCGGSFLPKQDVLEPES